MFTLKKTRDRDFVILNFSDTHMKKSELGEDHVFRKIFERTVTEAIASAFRREAYAIAATMESVSGFR